MVPRIAVLAPILSRPYAWSAGGMPNGKESDHGAVNRIAKGCCDTNKEPPDLVRAGEAMDKRRKETVYLSQPSLAPGTANGLACSS
jgi:hypothetical protein